MDLARAMSRGCKQKAGSAPLRYGTDATEPLVARHQCQTHLIVPAYMPHFSKLQHILQMLHRST